MAKVLELQHQSFQWIFTDFLQPWIFFGRINAEAEVPNFIVCLLTQGVMGGALEEADSLLKEAET